MMRLQTQVFRHATVALQVLAMFSRNFWWAVKKDEGANSCSLKKIAFSDVYFQNRPGNALTTRAVVLRVVSRAPHTC